MARAKPELRPSGIASGLRRLGGRSKLAGLDKFLLGMPANLKVSLNIYRGISIQLRCREKRIEAEDARDLFHQKYRGSRYSFGYPACPNLEDQTKLFALLKPEENVGVRLTSGFLLEPEQSTSAIMVHHPGAKYFVV
jgi:hypothetical protein